MVAPVGFGEELGRVAKQLHSAPHNNASITSRNRQRNARTLTDLAQLSSLALANPMRAKKDSTPQPSSLGRLRIGPAGWSYPDWSGFVYPSRRSKNFHEATFLAQFFDTIEINTSFYQPIRPDHATAWIERVAANPVFLFTAKLWQRFTHEPSATGEDERNVRAGFDVLRQAGKLGAVLLQFPFSFHKSPETSAHLSALLKRFADYPLVVELRHSSWQTQAALDLLREHNVGFCNIDQPVIGNSVTPSSQSTSPVGYVRFHGRRYDTWFNDDPKLPAHERYNYLYSPDELDPWVTRIEEVQKHTRNTFVVTNNHYQGKAVVNALQLLSILKGTKLKVPDDLRQHYPQLEQIASEMPVAPTLFPLGSPAGKNSKGTTS
jgi:uncharacterized protein YecE (DUF72 family)